MPRGVYKRGDIKVTHIAPEMQFQIAVPTVGAAIKLVNADNKVIGTIKVRNGGMSFTKANAKKKPTKQIAWNKLGAVSDLMEAIG